MRQIAPEESAISGDPVGLSIQFGLDIPVSKVGVCLDVTPEGASAAASADVQLVICHHPLIYSPLKKIDSSSDRVSQTIVPLITSRVALYAAHTNWDRAAGGINDTLAGMLQLENTADLAPSGDASLARVGDLSLPVSLGDFRVAVARTLGCANENELRSRNDDPTRLIRRVAVCGGAGAGFMHEAVAAGAEAYVTSDVRHHEFLDAAALGLALLDAGHGATERPGMQALRGRLTQEFPEVETIWLG